MTCLGRLASYISSMVAKIFKLKEKKKTLVHILGNKIAGKDI
jgi:hypothetical protein